ncbi:MAG: hypothetical protein CBC48_08325 [bacterium TMED88]|nr:hypothetical protein [Deltaproteobacteria bacterium]OUV32414.1 MAG: hypothetical protein CBC48_08325 [bacterium TMED88]
MDSSPSRLDSHTTGQSTIRQAYPQDRVLISDILGDAFTHDPALAWMGAPAERTSQFFRSEIESHYMHRGLMWVNQTETGAAIWLPPHAPRQTPFHWRILQSGWALFRAQGVEGLKRAEYFGKLLVRNRPKEPHFYLHAIGARLGHQGQGIGHALLRAGLALCDQQHMPAYLESTNALNPPLYRKHGFEAVSEERLPDDGPPITFMYRPPRPT